MLRTILLSTTLLGLTSNAWAVTPSNQPHIIITATKTPIAKDKVGSSVTVITREDIEKSGESQVFDLIKKAPGVALTRNGGAGSTSTIRLRGSNPGQVRVMIDGVFMNDVSGANSEYDFNNLLVNSIERIEILRGPQSALYGSDAMGGVINIITRRGSGPMTVNALAEVGSYKTHREAAGISGGKNALTYSLQVQNFKTQGFSRFDGGVEDDGSTNQSINGALGWTINDIFSLDTSGSFSQLKSEFDATTADRANVQKKYSLSGRTALTAKTLEGKWEHIMSLQGASTRRDFDEPLTASTRFSTFDGLQTTAEYQSNYKLRTRDIITTGLVHERQDAENTATTSAAVKTTNVNRGATINSLYGQYLLGFGDTTTFTIGGRRDDHSQFGAKNTYRFTAAQEVPLTHTVLRASYGNGFKAPTLYQLYHPTFGTITLQPETSTGYDFGFDQHFLNRRLTLSSTVFHNDYKNLILFDSVTSKYLNLRKATTEGLESSIDYQLTPELSLNASHTYLLTEDGTTTRVLQRRPKHTFVAGADYLFTDAGSLGMDVRYVSRESESTTGARTFIKPYTVVDLRGEYKVSQPIAVYSRIENLFDKHYQEARGFASPGFSVYTGIKATY